MITPHCYFHEPKLCFLMLIHLLVFRDDETPLHRSAVYDRVEVCRLLLQSGADVNARDRSLPLIVIFMNRNSVFSC